MEKIVIYGGTFDPIHNGHLRIAHYASLKLNADVFFVLAKSPRWKEPFASINHRLNMLKLALKADGSGSFCICDYEIKSTDKINYTIDTVKYFKKKYRKHDLCLLIGADQIDKFNEWKDADELSNLCQIYYVNRTDIPLNVENIKKYKMISLDYDKAGNVSSSDIRTLKSLDTPFEVIKYIENNNLYYIKKLSDEFYDERRFKHAISVANVAYNIAIRNRREDFYDCYIAGLIHDMAKKLSYDKTLEIMNTYFKKFVNLVPPNLYHQFVGVYLARSYFQITNESVLDAIMYHATGKAHMTPIGKIIYSADKIDPLRGYDSKKMIRACYRNYYSGFIKVLKENKKYLLEKKLNFNNKFTKECIELYLGEKNK